MKILLEHVLQLCKPNQRKFGGPRQHIPASAPKMGIAGSTRPRITCPDEVLAAVSAPAGSHTANRKMHSPWKEQQRNSQN